MFTSLVYPNVFGTSSAAIKMPIKNFKKEKSCGPARPQRPPATPAAPAVRGFWGGGAFVHNPRSQSPFTIVNGVHNFSQFCERRSQNLKNKYQFYAFFRILTISFLLQKGPSQPRSLLSC